MRFAAFAVLTIAAPCAASTIFVDDSAPPPGDGLSWTTAFTDLQDALDAARGDANIDAIRVAEGTYLPDRGTGDKSLSYELVDGVTLLGGFPNGGGMLSERDRDLHVTMLSGDLAGDDGAATEFGYWEGIEENATHIVVATQCGSSTTIDGFVIRGGYADDTPMMNGTYGGDLLIDGGAPVVSNCRFERGRAQRGGGIALVESAALVDGCEFRENTGSSFGGGLAVIGSVDADVRNCLFESNIGGSGPGLACVPANIINGVGNASTIANCQFIGSTSPIGATAGGGIYTRHCNVHIRRCEFIDNETDGGGGIGLDESGALVERCLFRGNRGDGDGGGAILAFNFDFGGTQPISTVDVVSCLMTGNNGAVFGIRTDINLVNCTLVHNHLADLFLSWPVLRSQDSVITIGNSIIWGNLDFTLLGGDRPFLTGSPTYSASNSIIEDWDGTFPGSAIDADPGFVDATGPDGDPLATDDNDYHLRLDSPALDAGDNAALSAGANFDVEGNTRIKDGDADGAATVDIGALERCPLNNPDEGCDILGDLNDDGAVNLADVSQFVADCLAGSGSILSNVNRDGHIDGRDVQPFVAVLLDM